MYANAATLLGFKAQPCHTSDKHDTMAINRTVFDARPFRLIPGLIESRDLSCTAFVEKGHQDELISLSIFRNTNYECAIKRTGACGRRVTRHATGARRVDERFCLCSYWEIACS